MMQTPSREEMWEDAATRGLIPAEWVGDPARAFVRCDGGPLADAPGTLLYEKIVTLGPGWVLACEALARDVVHRLAPWGALQPARAVWRALLWQRNPSYHRHPLPRPVPLYMRSAYEALKESCKASPRFSVYGSLGIQGCETDSLEERHKKTAALAEMWDVCARRGKRLPHFVTGLAGTPYAKLPNPFPPLAEMLARGTILIGVSEADMEIAASVMP